TPELDNDEDIKILHSPFFYIDIEIKNISKISQKISTFIGFDMEGQLVNKNLIFEDKGKNHLSKKKNIFVLRNLQPDREKYHIEEDGKFRGYLSIIQIEPGKDLTLRYIYAGFTDDFVFLNKFRLKEPYNLKFLYTNFYTSIEDVLNYAENNYNKIIEKSSVFENLLTSYDAPPEKKFLIALAFRTFLANTWLLISEMKTVEYYVWEGNFGMNSSVDIAMEVEILAKIFPWTLKLQLNEWKKYITINKANGLFYLMHDMGIDQEVGYSYYETSSRSIYGRSSELKPLAVENNANFSILLYWYYYITKDIELLENLYPSAFKLLIANIKRGFRKRGIANLDTTTTYNASEVLYNSPLNMYLGIKECISYIMCRELSNILGLKKDSELLQNEAEKILDTLEYLKERYGYIPVSFDIDTLGWEKRTITTADPLFYVAMTALKDPIIDKIVDILTKDFENIYHANDTKIYGVRLVENEKITWFSKVAIIDAVCSILFKIKKDSWNYAYERNINNPMAYVEGAFSDIEEWYGKKNPRGISLIWEIVHHYKLL
ncbi:MAG: glycoside hydrolase family 52 protein, partial [Promethearchaeota archaeon]